MMPSRIINKDESKPFKYTRISNSLLECFVHKKNIIALKIVFYLSMNNSKISFSKSALTTLNISISSLSKSLKTDRKTILRNLKKMQDTSISFVSFDNDRIELNESISIFPRLLYSAGSDNIEIDIYNKVLELIKDVQSRFTVINSYDLVKLKNINTIKFIGLLKIIDSYSEHVAKKKSYTLFELNSLFDVNYKNFYEFERKIIKPVQHELDEESQLSFIYNFNFESVGRGRPRIKEIVIYLKENKNRQLKLF